jgi:enoyl-CoA hydratase/carnithine racemase
MSDQPDEVLTNVENGVMTITLNRPDKLNAVTFSMLLQTIDAFDRADADDDVRVVIVTGTGRAFCAGADLSAGGAAFDYEGDGADSAVATAATPAMPKLPDGPLKANGELRDGGGILTLRIFRCRKPVIGAINGPAVGIGSTMTLPMDIRLASESAKFGFVFAARGIVPEACSSYFLPRVVGISTALEWCYTAKLIPAAEALDAGLVRSVHAPDDLAAVAHELAEQIAASAAPVSAALTRMMMWRMLGAQHPMEAHRIDSRGVNHTGRMADATEGITAFFEKRDPNWSLSVNDDMPDFVPWWDEPQFE